MEEEVRFSYQTIDPYSNLPHLLKFIADEELLALVDKEAGGIISYVNREHINKILKLLNK